MGKYVWLLEIATENAQATYFSKVEGARIGFMTSDCRLAVRFADRASAEAVIPFLPFQDNWQPVEHAFYEEL